MVTVLKIDVDVKMDNVLLIDFLSTRLAILEKLGYELLDVNYRETKHGFHFWFKIAEDLDDKRKAEVQFLLGDDHRRCEFNFFRAKAGVFNDFNALFSKKKKVKVSKLKILKLRIKKILDRLIWALFLLFTCYAPPFFIIILGLYIINLMYKKGYL